MASTLFNEFPRGPRIRPTKLYCCDMSKKKTYYIEKINRYDSEWKNTVRTYIWIFVDRDVKPDNSLHYRSRRNSLWPMPTHWRCLKGSHSLDIPIVLHREHWYCIKLPFYKQKLWSKLKLSCHQFSSQHNSFFITPGILPMCEHLVYQCIC